MPLLMATSSIGQGNHLLSMSASLTDKFFYLVILYITGRL